MTKTARRAGVAFAALLLGFVATACTDLLIEPESDPVAGNVFKDASAYRSFLAKIYAGLVTTGQQGPAGSGDIEAINDEGFSQYWRQYWQMQELPTDEAIIGWGDADLPELNTMQWASSNQFFAAMYSRVFFQAMMANEFLRETSDSRLSERGHQDIAEIPQYRAEARFLRALSYYHGLDLFGDIPIVDETFPLGSTPPDQAARGDVFQFVVDELNAIRLELAAPGMAQYGRVDRGAADMLLAKLFLNAEVYTGTPRWAEALNAAAAVIAGPWTLDDEHEDMFLADNHTSPEIIFAIPQDGSRTQTWGGMTYLTHAAVGGNMDAASYGLDGGWWGLRATEEFSALFEGGPNGPDSRSDYFYTAGHTAAVTSIGDFFSGYPYPKYRNVTAAGVPGSNATFPDTDFPMFRLADAYLMYAEAHLRGGAGDAATALGYVNALRQRAYGDNSGDITAPELTLAFILDERARELAWEAHRRQDLVRFEDTAGVPLFTSDAYLWDFKGGVTAGTGTAVTRALYPIPSNELIANPKLVQNPGY